MTVCLLSLGGLPPTVGFIGKWYIFSAAVSAGYYGLAIIGVLTSVISVFFYLRVVVMMYMAERGTRRSAAARRRHRHGGAGAGDHRHLLPGHPADAGAGPRRRVDRDDLLGRVRRVRRVGRVKPSVHRGASMHLPAYLPTCPPAGSRCGTISTGVGHNRRIDRELTALEGDLKRLEAEYNMYFAGRLQRPPWETRARVEATVKRLDRTHDQQLRRPLPLHHAADAAQPLPRPLGSRAAGARRGAAGAAHRSRGRPSRRRPIRSRIASSRWRRSTIPSKEDDKVRELYDSFVEARRRPGRSAWPSTSSRRSSPAR